MSNAPTAAALTGLRVLVVEDEFLVALDLSSILDDLGCIVLGLAATVPEALRLLAADPPDVTLLDINLDGARTTPVALALAADGVPFIAVTAYASLPSRCSTACRSSASPSGRSRSGTPSWRFRGRERPARSLAAGTPSSRSYCRRTAP